MSDANSGNAQPEHQVNADFTADNADGLASEPDAASPEPTEPPEPQSSDWGDGWDDDGGAAAQTRADGDAADAPAVGEATEVVATSSATPGGPDLTEVVTATETPGTVDVTEVVAAQAPGANEATEVVAAEPTSVYPSGAEEVPPTTVDDAAQAGAAPGAAAPETAAAAWTDAPPPPYPAATPPPAYAAAPAAAAAGTYGAVTPSQPGPQTSNKAVVAMVLAVLSFVFCPVILAVAALIVGGQAKSEIAASNGWLTGDGLVTGAKILAWVNIALTILAVIFMVIFFAALGNGLSDLQINIDPSSGLGT